MKKINVSLVDLSKFFINRYYEINNTMKPIDPNDYICNTTGLYPDMVAAMEEYICDLGNHFNLIASLEKEINKASDDKIKVLDISDYTILGQAVKKCLSVNFEGKPISISSLYKKSVNNTIMFDNRVYNLEPHNVFYNYMVCRNLYSNQDSISGIMEYDCFSCLSSNKKDDFSPAEACAIYVSLCRCGKIDVALSSIDAFRDAVYPDEGYTHPVDITDWGKNVSAYMPGQTINHTILGEGVIVNNDGKYITVNFSGEIKTLDAATADYKRLIQLT